MLEGVSVSPATENSCPLYIN